WSQGRIKIDSKGYKKVLIHGHPREDANGYVFEHTLIAEKALGKPLLDGVVIHHYGKKTENHKIVICQDSAYHNLIQRRQRAFECCGHADWRKCYICKKYDATENLYISLRKV